VNHIDAMLKCNPDNVILGEISADGGQALANLISFIGLETSSSSEKIRRGHCNRYAPNLLTVRREPVFVRIDRNGVHSEFMCGSEDPDGNFLFTHMSKEL
jgi:hypothetical protein